MFLLFQSEKKLVETPFPQLSLSASSEGGGSSMTQCVSSLVQMSVFFSFSFTEEKDLEWRRGRRLSKGVEEREARIYVDA